MRQPAVTGVALAIFNAGAACATPLLKTKVTRSSTPSVPAERPRSLSPCMTSRYGSSSSCQTRTSALLSNGPFASCSRSRSSSNAGATRNGSPLAGSTSAPSRSLFHQLTFAKYTSELPPIMKIASSLLAVMSWRARSMRCRRSSPVIGRAWSRMDLSAWMDAGCAAVGSLPAVNGRKDVPAATAPNLRTSRRETMGAMYRSG